MSSTRRRAIQALSTYVSIFKLGGEQLDPLCVADQQLCLCLSIQVIFKSEQRKCGLIMAV